MTFKNTGEMCVVLVSDFNREEGFKTVDLGNYFVNELNGEKCLITSREYASKYKRLVDVPIYVRKEKK
jgi:hypothetical protein